MAKSSEFFNVQPIETVLGTLFANWQPELKTESIDPRQALGRVLATAAHSPIALPQFVRGTMDGYAVRAADTFGASQSLPAYLTVVGEVMMGTVAEIEVKQGQATISHTGGMLPQGADAVVMVERTQQISDTEIEVLAAVAPGENLIQIGEDVEVSDEILPAGHCIRPQDIGGLLAVGVLSVDVTVAPRVGILSSGDELIPPEQIPEPGQIVDINAHTLAALIKEAGGEPVLLGISSDKLEDYQQRANDGFAATDMLIMTAGSSVSARDLTGQVINNLGEPGVLQHGLAVRPGKPTIIAVCNDKPVIGLPGNPVSAFMVSRQIVIPTVKRLLDQKTKLTPLLTATLAANIASITGRFDSIPVRLVERENELMAEPVFGKSNLIYTLINADGFVTVPLNSNGLKAGEPVDVQLFD